MVVVKRNAVEANALIFNSKTKETRKAKYANSDTKLFMWFRQHCSPIGHAMRVLPFMESAVGENDFGNIEKEFFLANLGLTLFFLFFRLKNV